MILLNIYTHKHALNKGERERGGCTWRTHSFVHLVHRPSGWLYEHPFFQQNMKNFREFVSQVRSHTLFDMEKIGITLLKAAKRKIGSLVSNITRMNHQSRLLTYLKPQKIPSIKSHNTAIQQSTQIQARTFY